MLYRIYFYLLRVNGIFTLITNISIYVHSSLQNSSLSAVEFEQVCEETLDSLAEKFDSLADTDMMPPDFDVQLAVRKL
jgi:hypothetical protein